MINIDPLSNQENLPQLPPNQPVQKSGVAEVVSKVLSEQNQQNPAPQPAAPKRSVFRGTVPPDYTGKARVTYEDGSIYRGPMLNGKRHGADGKLTLSNGDLFKGQWENNELHGKGEAKLEDRQYWGEWKNGKREGQGFEILKSGTMYDGAWRADKKDGYGSLVSANWTVFKGQFLNGKACYGEMSTLNACTYIGQIANGTYNGYGKIIQNGRVIQEGIYANGRLVTPIQSNDTKTYLFL